MRTNLSIKALSLLLAGMMTFGLASCKDDEIASDFDEPDVNIPIPTEDEVKTTVGKTYAVFGEQFDEVTPYVLKRMTGQRYNYTPADTEIADDVEVVFMDTKALTGMNEEMAYELKELYDRDGVIYMHKPNALALAFFQMLVNDELDDFMEWMEENTGGGKIDTRTVQDGDPLTRDSYILSRNSSLDMQDIYDGKEITREATVTEIDENGKEQTRTVTETFTPTEPTDYEYGLFAESVAKWLNDDGVQTKTRANGGADLEMPYTKTILAPCRVQRIGDDKQITANAEITIRAASLYSPQENEDFYYVTVEQMIPVESFAKGEYYFKSRTGPIMTAQVHRARGYTYGSHAIDLPQLEADGYNVTTGNLQPLAKGAVPTTLSVDGWAAGSDVCQDNTIVGKLESTYHPEVLALAPEERLTKFYYEPSETHNGSKYWFYFSNEADNYYTLKFLDLSHPNCKNVVTRQSFTYKVSNTAKRGLNPFKMKIHNKFRFHVAWKMQSGGECFKYVDIYDDVITASLPAPNRYISKHTIAPDEKYSDWNTVETLLNSCRQYKELKDNQYCRDSENSLKNLLERKWYEAKQALEKKNLDLSAVKNNYIIRMTNGEGKEIGSPLYIGPNGVNLFGKGSYYMSDGSFLPAKTKLTEEQKRNCIGIVCVGRTSDSELPNGINGFAIALHDANQTPCAWGDATPFSKKGSNNWLPINHGAGYNNTHNLMLAAAQKDGKEPSKEWYPVLYYALNYPVANPKSNKGWFLPSRNDLLDATSLSDEAFEKAGGDPLVRDRVYASSSLFEELEDLGNFNYRFYNLVTTCVLRGENKDVEFGYKAHFNAEDEIFYVRPFIAF